MTEQVYDNQTDWVNKHIRRYVESGGAKGHRFYGKDALLLTTRGRRTGKLRGLRLMEVTREADGRFAPVEGTERELECQLVLLAMGFVGPEKGALLSDLGVDLDERGNVARDRNFMTNVEGVFSSGDMGRGQSLIVWAIAEGRAAAAGVDSYLTGREVLPRPIEPTDRPIT